MESHRKVLMIFLKTHYAVGRMGWNSASMEAKRALKDGVLDYSGIGDMGHGDTWRETTYI